MQKILQRSERRQLPPGFYNAILMRPADGACAYPLCETAKLFVMSTREGIDQAIDDFNQGRFGQKIM
ncbi:hypothetical protein [Dryocola sp. BD613]|uniref:hypothetical protein n=1 Tax=Dryocola sp. BD613 TaxID=3133272 RepID=UPI003F5095F6